MASLANCKGKGRHHLRGTAFVIWVRCSPVPVNLELDSLQFWFLQNVLQCPEMGLA